MASQAGRSHALGTAPRAPYWQIRAPFRPSGHSSRRYGAALNSAVALSHDRLLPALSRAIHRSQSHRRPAPPCCVRGSEHVWSRTACPRAAWIAGPASHRCPRTPQFRPRELCGCHVAGRRETQALSVTMPMTMVEVRIVRMLVSHGFMPVPVGMRFGDSAVMIMPMVRVMNMGMVVL